MTCVFRFPKRKPVTFEDCIFHCGPASQVVLRARQPEGIGPFKYAAVYAPGMVWFYSAMQDEADLLTHMDSNEKPLEWYWMERKAIPAGARITNIHFNPWGDFECALDKLIRFLEGARVVSIDDLDQSGLHDLWSHSPGVEILLGSYESTSRWEQKIWTLMNNPDAVELLKAIIDPLTHTVYDLFNDLVTVSRSNPLTEDQMTQLVPLLRKYDSSEVQKIYGNPTCRAWFDSMDELQILKEQYDLETERYADVLNHPLFQQMIEETRSKNNFELRFRHGTYTILYDGLRITPENLPAHVRYRTLDELKHLFEQTKADWLSHNTAPFSERTLSFFSRLGLIAYILIPEPIDVSSRQRGVLA